MKQLLTRIFPRLAQGNQAALPTPDNNPDNNYDVETLKLREKFRNAVYGNQFRTLAYIDALDDPATADQEWLEAFHMPNQGWKIKRMMLHNGDVTDTPAVRQDVLEERYTFFEAAQKLAQYEATQGNLHKEACESPTVEDLGYGHVRAFAEREGLAFDIDGVLHPTEDGAIVTDGWFAPEAYKKAEIAFCKAKEIHSVPIKDLVSALLNDSNTVDIAKLRYADAISDTLDDIIPHLRLARNSVQNITSYGCYAYQEAVDNKGFPSNCSRESLLQFKAVAAIFNYQKYLGSKNFHIDPVLVRPLDLGGFFMAVSLASETAYKAHRNEKNAAEYCSPKRINHFKMRAVQKL